MIELATTQSNPFDKPEMEFTPGLPGSVVMDELLDEGDEDIGILLYPARRIRTRVRKNITTLFYSA